jgi:hypothetical protein
MTSKATVAPQFMRALQAANQVRLARAELKVLIAKGDVAAADVVLTCPTEAARMALTDLLLAQRSWGPARCRRLLCSASLREDKTIGSMTDRQRGVVASLLAESGTR